MDFPWNVVASPAAAFVAAVIVVSVFVYNNLHKDAAGCLSRRRLASVMLLSASVYTFAVCAFSEVFLKGPHLSHLVEHGFGNGRVSYLLIGVIIDASFRIWFEYDQAKSENAAI